METSPTLSPVVNLSFVAPLSWTGILGNVYGPGGGFAHSPLGGGMFNDLADATADLAEAALETLSIAAATAPPGAQDLTSNLGVSPVGDPNLGGGGGDGGDGGPGAPGAPGDGPGGDGGDGGD